MSEMPRADLAINQPDVALIFEGGGMRNSYTAPMVVELLARNLNFGGVYGISAGSSHTVNYLVRDATRARASFVELVKYPRFGGWGSFLRGTGYFNSPYLYEELIENAPAGDPMAFDWDTFATNPAEMHIEAMDWDTGETVAWTRADVKDAHDLGLKVRASSTMPLFMPPTTIDGRTYMDGGMGDSWGILLNAARADGYERFCIIRTQPRGYRKHAMRRGAQALFRSAFRKQPRGYRFTFLDKHNDEISVGVATDLGVYTPQVQQGLCGCQVVMLESNYDEGMIRVSDYPYYLKRRIQSQNGHLSNGDCATALTGLASQGTRHFVLGHLSKNNNMELLAHQAAHQALSQAGFVEDRDFTLQVARRSEPSIPILLSDSPDAPAANLLLKPGWTAAAAPSPAL